MSRLLRETLKQRSTGKKKCKWLREKCQESDSVSGQQCGNQASVWTFFRKVQIEMWKGIGKRTMLLHWLNHRPCIAALTQERQSGGTKLPWCLEHLMAAHNPKELYLCGTIVYPLIYVQVLRGVKVRTEFSSGSPSFMQEIGFCLVV